MTTDITAVEAALADTGRILVSHPPFAERWQAARTHEANRLTLAELRTEAGTATPGDQRAIETERLRGRS